MMATKPLLTTFVDPPPEWGVDVMQDQQPAGALAWSYGDLILADFDNPSIFDAK